MKCPDLPRSGDPEQVERLLEQVRGMEESTLKRILDAADPAIADAVRARLFTEAGTLEVDVTDEKGTLDTYQVVVEPEYTAKQGGL